MSRQGRKRVRPVTVAATSYDRRSVDLPINSVVLEAVVDDPLEKGATLIVFRSLRDDPLARMFSHKQIDCAQYHAGRHMQRLYETSTIGAVRAIDPMKEAVDGGAMPDALSDRQMHATDQIIELEVAAGLNGGALLRDVLGKGMFLKDCAASRGLRSDEEVRGVGVMFRAALEKITKALGYAA